MEYRRVTAIVTLISSAFVIAASLSVSFELIGHNVPAVIVSAAASALLIACIIMHMRADSDSLARHQEELARLEYGNGILRELLDS